MLRLVLLSAMLLGCSPATEVEQSVWMPYEYRPALDEDGTQTGWILTEFRLDMAPPPERTLDDGTVEIPLDIEVERREVLKDLDWVPPQDLERRELVDEGVAISRRRPL